VKKDKSSVLFYSHLDNQRLQETFFTPEKKPVKPKKKKIIFLPVISILVVLLLFFIFNYDLVLVPRSNLLTANQTPSLFSKDLLSSVSFIGGDKKLMRAKKSLVYLIVPEGQKVGVKFDLKKPIDLNTNQLLLWVEKAKVPFNMEVVARDKRFFSNAREPLKIIMDKKDNSSYNKIPIQFQSAASSNVNFAKINQIKMYFYQPIKKEESISSDKAIQFKEKNWILIKDIDLEAKEDK
jgi:hypothetical protein